MNRLNETGSSVMRRALFAGLLGLALVVLCSGVALARTTKNGPHAYVDSATDDGGGRIRIAWSLQAESADLTFLSSTPEKVCVGWKVVENGVTKGSVTETCFTSEASSQSDLVVDTGIGGDGPTTVFSVTLVPYYRTYYGSTPLFPVNDEGVWRWTQVTLNA
ncbi:MAG: hypothetical protein OXQ29_23460 [Rhodospirillaceae bacterium]|nr:hypothetical protein [Rhodospirillaceae bacterium]